ncbi:MAG: gliding motility lipoprotein GldH [Saprospiraceae bacterium]|nr:gliding motility lipoprotein GldH [Saprospiraceae bacterium]
MKKALLILSFLSFILLACGPKYVIDKTYDITNNEWTYADSLRFEFEIQDTLKLYDLILELKHSTDFGYQNLYTQIHTTFPDGMRLSKPVSLEIANPAGEWQGKCNSKSCAIEIPIQQGAYFNQIGAYSIVLEQYMRENPIKGVQSLTLKVQETGALRTNSGKQ